jgi:quercetin dioxygenase-like cupin family protein
MGKNTKILNACLANPQNLIELVDYADDSIVSKTIIDSRQGTITIFAFDQGQALSEHQVPHNAFVNVLQGKGTFTIDSTEHTVMEGQVVIMPANIPHSVRAEQKFKWILTIIRN